MWLYALKILDDMKARNVPCWSIFEFVYFFEKIYFHLCYMFNVYSSYINAKIFKIMFAQVEYLMDLGQFLRGRFRTFMI